MVERRLVVQMRAVVRKPSVVVVVEMMAIRGKMVMIVSKESVIVDAVVYRMLVLVGVVVRMRVLVGMMVVMLVLVVRVNVVIVIVVFLLLVALLVMVMKAADARLREVVGHFRNERGRVVEYAVALVFLVQQAVRAS